MEKMTFSERWKRLSEKLMGIAIFQDQITRYLILTLVLSALIGIVCLVVYDRTHCFDDYSVSSRGEVNDVDGTLYQKLGSHIIKYSHDGVFCVDSSNNMAWSVAYTMQTPIADVNGKTMAIAEQQGKQVYVLNESGLIGNFTTTLPIVGMSVSSRGETALILDDADAAWINLYQADGTQIAAVNSSMEGSGYPLDVALSSNAKRMMVSFLGTNGSSVCGKIHFYDFSSAGDADEDHLAGTFSYDDRIFPEIYYTDRQVPVAVGSNAYVVFTESSRPKKKQTIEITREIVSTFHDNSSIGFVYHSDSTEMKYHMEVLSLGGRKMMEADFGFEYEDVRMEDGEILLYDSSSLHVYRTSGKAKLKTTYQKNVNYFTTMRGLRRYLVITDDTIDKIRIS